MDIDVVEIIWGKWSNRFYRSVWMVDGNKNYIYCIIQCKVEDEEGNNRKRFFFVGRPKWI